MSFKPMLQTPGMFQTISKNDRRSPCRRFADWSAGKKMNKGLSWKLMEVDGGSGFSANSEVFWYFAYLCIILHLQPWHLWRKWPDGHLPQRDPDCESKLTDLSRSPKGWHFWGPFPAGVGQASLGIAMAAMDDGKSTDDQSIMDLFASNCVGSLFLQIV